MALIPKLPSKSFAWLLAARPLLCSPLTHQEMFLLLFAHDHNVRHTCDQAWQTFLRAQSNRTPDETEPALSSGHVAAGACVVPGPAKRRKRQPTAACEGNPDAAGPNPPDAACARQLTSASPEDEVVINPNSSTVHLMSDISAVETRCGWRFDGAGQKPRRAKTLTCDSVLLWFVFCSPRSLFAAEASIREVRQKRALTGRSSVPVPGMRLARLRVQATCHHGCSHGAHCRLWVG